MPPTAHENIAITFVPTEKHFKHVGDNVTWRLCVILERTNFGVRLELLSIFLIEEDSLFGKVIDKIILFY